MSVTHLIAGPAEHGVTRLALELHATTALRDDPMVLVDDGAGATLASSVPAGARGVHLHFTDRLFGASAVEAAGRIAALADSVPLTVTLHDLPQQSDGPGAFERRAVAYARVVASARGVVLNSRHEQALLDAGLSLAGRPELAARSHAVIPLPIDRGGAGPAVRENDPKRRRDLVLLGFLYPGKGHSEALDALRDLPPDVGLVAAGRPSEGHDDLVGELRERATALGRRFEVTGYVPDDELPALLHAAAVPVAPHRHLSASGSINSWLSAGRRPLVPRGRYVAEIESRCPGALFLYDDLAAAATQALAQPELTWLRPGVHLGPSREEVGAAYADLLGRWHA